MPDKSVEELIEQKKQLEYKINNLIEDFINDNSYDIKLDINFHSSQGESGGQIMWKTLKAKVTIEI